MKRLIFTIMLLASIAIPAAAQTPTPIIPQTSNATIFNAVSTAQTSPCLSNQGQNVWISNYIVSGGTPNSVQYRLEYSYNSDSATCTTGTWFTMSDDGSDLSQAEVIGLGSYPFVRANLVNCDGCGGGVTVTAFYNNSTAMNGTLFGFYNPSQQVTKVLFSSVPDSGTSSVSIPCPYGSTAGKIVIHSNSSTPSGALTLAAKFGSTTLQTITVGPNLSTVGTGYTIGIPIAPTSCQTVVVTKPSGASSVHKVTAIYFFYPPGATGPASVQPDSNGVQTSNQEITSATNTAASVTLGGTVGGGNTNDFRRGYLFSVNARCSAGTAQLTIIDGNATQIWSSAATEVGTTSFTKSWNPGLSSNPNPSVLPSQLVITLGTCGVGNTGTLDVEGSVF